MSVARVAGVLLVLSAWAGPAGAGMTAREGRAAVAVFPEHTGETLPEAEASPPAPQMAAGAAGPSAEPPADAAAAAAQTPPPEVPEKASVTLAASPAALRPPAAVSALGSAPETSEPEAAPPPATDAATPPDSAAQPLGALPEAQAAPPAPPPPPPPALVIGVDLARQQATVIENGRTEYVWPISSGTRRYPTETGEFTAIWTSRLHYSKQWDNAPMPYAVFFNRGTAFHGTSATRALGRPASHGCVRLATPNAKILYRLVNKYGVARTRVLVHSEPAWEERETASRRSARRSTAARSRKARRNWSYAQHRPRRETRRRRYIAQPYKSPFSIFWE